MEEKFHFLYLFNQPQSLYDVPFYYIDKKRRFLLFGK